MDERTREERPSDYHRTEERPNEGNAQRKTESVTELVVVTITFSRFTIRHDHAGEWGRRLGISPGALNAKTLGPRVAALRLRPADDSSAVECSDQCT